MDTRGRNGEAQLTAAAGMVPSSVAAPAGPVPQMTVDGIEIVQVVQNVSNSVLLVAGKQALVRIYLSSGLHASVTIRGTLAMRRASSGGWTQIPSAANVVVNPADNGPPGLRRKREDLTLSLNFHVPAALLSAGAVQWELSGLQTVNPTATVAVPAGTSGYATFQTAVPIRVHIIGVRYHSPGAPNVVFEPTPIDYALIQSWLGRAYPVSQVVWSQTSVDWPGSLPPWPGPNDPGDPLGTWGRDQVNSFISTIRMQDVASGTDHRTHYFGLAADGGGFMRGWASTIPAGPDPTAVASGPAGPSGFPWDTDGSYADWYTGHELAHTFGRAHPGYCPGNSRDDLAFPYPNGQIANNNGDFVGYDPGDPKHSIPAQALPGVKWHDLMTYCDFQWLSAYTYEAIYHRLVAEDALPRTSPGGAVPAVGQAPSGPNPSTNGGAGMTLSSGIHVVARVNQTKGKGEFRFVTPVALAANVLPAHASQTPAGPGGYILRVLKVDAAQATDFPVALRRDACGDLSNTDVTGSVEAILPNDPAAVAIELRYDNQLLDTFTPGAEPLEPTDIRPATSAAGAVPSALAFHTASVRPKIAWSPKPTSAGPIPMAAMSGTGRGPAYTVQVSADGGRTWQTVGVGLTAPEVTLDSQIYADRDSIQVRVTATNGFRAKTATQTLLVRDL